MKLETTLDTANVFYVLMGQADFHPMDEMDREIWSGAGPDALVAYTDDKSVSESGQALVLDGDEMEISLMNGSEVETFRVAFKRL